MKFWYVVPLHNIKSGVHRRSIVIWSYFGFGCKFPSLSRSRNCASKFVAALRASKNAALAVPKEAVVLGFHCRRV